MYPYCKILKTPCIELNSEQVIKKYEIVIKEKYPVLDYLLKNRETLGIISHLYNVISLTNKLKVAADFMFSRGESLQVSLRDFW